MADVASLLGTSPGSLAHQLYVRTPSYQCFYIPKKAGGSREINAPQEPIATYQRIIASIISAIYRPHRAVHGFCPDRSVVTNARRHVARRLVLNFDIRDFFPSIPFGRVRWALMRPPLGLNSRVATIVAQICCFQGRLAQGAPSSPVLSNLVCRRLDHQLSRLAVLAGCSYTRYADDLTLSTRDASFPAAIVANSGTTPPTLSAEIAEILRQSGFHINPEKTRIQGPATRKVVTGLIVNARPNVPRAYVRELRAALHSWRRHGESAADARFATVYASVAAPQTASFPWPDSVTRYATPDEGRALAERRGASDARKQGAGTAACRAVEVSRAEEPWEIPERAAGASRGLRQGALPLGGNTDRDRHGARCPQDDCRPMGG
ncbi:reverse transcriptase domain-containing protein [Sorangium sp. So ce448]|uniref:reverse transcriptase domain-containing protein n=1 Tax=Sorangium sp. So ce448 TaxID=3133314 RepID=UPI003F5E9851